jgi:putative GTP pyrophosphokinase
MTVPPPELPLSAEQIKQIDDLVRHYLADQEKYAIFLNGLRTAVEIRALVPLIHSIRYRLKDAEHYRDKLHRKMREALADNEAFEITPENWFRKVTDLAGLRILHLHTRQFAEIDDALRAGLDEQQIKIVEGPFARAWDDESRAYFEGLKIETRESGENLYTSVHYIVEANSRTKLTGEIQVRTLAEELWGEVDHTINYPHRTNIATCREQILVLARATSTCSRLVDSIFAAHVGKKG